jgi:hypothetical protein
MTFRPDTESILHEVESLTGTPVEVLPDPSLAVLAKVTMARPGLPAHLVRYNPSRQDPDYLIAYECGFILREYANPQELRLQFTDTESGRAAVMEMLQGPRGLASTLPLGPVELQQYADKLRSGVLLQLRSMPVGMRIDAWLHTDYPSLAELQADSLNQQQRTNAQALAPKYKTLAPQRIYASNVSMNAAFAQFCDRLLGSSGYTIPYRAAGLDHKGRTLLNIWDRIDAEPTHDRELIDAWGHELKLASWYQWVAPA